MDHSANALDPAEVVIRKESLDAAPLWPNESCILVEPKRARVDAQDLGRHADGISGQIIRDEHGRFRQGKVSQSRHTNNLGRAAAAVKDHGRVHVQVT
jgi:hypothetical protein